LRLYFRAATDILTDGKFLLVGDSGLAMFMRGLAYSKEHLTDGFVPDHVLPLVGIGCKNPFDLARKMVEAELWVRVENGYEPRPGKWEEFQTTADEVAEIREKNAKRQADYKARKKEEREQKKQADAAPCSNGFHPSQSAAEQQSAIMDGLPESHQTPEMRTEISNWLTMRKQKKHGFIADAQIPGLCGVLALQTPENAVEAVKQATRGAYKAFFAVSDGHSNGKHTPPVDPKSNPLLAELRQRQEREQNGE
jgi:hypothetical protein